MFGSSYDSWLERQREKYEAPLGYCQCGTPASTEHRHKGRTHRFCEDCDQEPPEDDDDC